MPLCMIAASIGLLGLYAARCSGTAWRSFAPAVDLSRDRYVFETAMAFALDPPTARRAWAEAILFPGVISLVIIIYSVAPEPLRALFVRSLEAMGVDATPRVVFGLQVFALYLADGRDAGRLRRQVDCRALAPRGCRHFSSSLPATARSSAPSRLRHMSVRSRAHGSPGTRPSRPERLLYRDEDCRRATGHAARTGRSDVAGRSRGRQVGGDLSGGSRGRHGCREAPVLQGRLDRPDPRAARPLREMLR